jgi:hypothetical protein
MTNKEKLSFLMSLQARLATLEAEVAAEIDADEPDADFDELDEHAKDAFFAVEDIMAGIEVAK